MIYRYYLLMRPLMPGAIPKCKIENSMNFDERRYIPVIGRCAWAWFDTFSKLSQKDVRDYELYELNLSELEVV